MELILKNISCGYHSKLVIKNFSAQIKSGEVFCILGPNGIGKTTLFKSILGFLDLFNGQVLVNGQDLAQINRIQRARIMAYVPQSQFTPFAFRVFDVILMGRTARLGLLSQPGPDDIAVVEQILEELHLSALKNRLFTELSGGEKQMVIIARALSQEPSFLMMDEPTSSLDFGNQLRILSSIKMLASRGLGIIMTTHFPDHVFECATTVALLRPGQESLIGDLSSIMTSQNLSDTYQVPIKVISIPEDDRNFRICRPAINTELTL